MSFANWRIAILGVVQGLTEFLPVSSSAHLVILNDLLGVGQPTMSLAIFLHLGTLLAVLVVYFRELVRMVVGMFTGRRDGRLGWFVVLGSVPAALLGLALKSVIEKAFSSTLMAGVMLIITGFILYWSGRLRQGRRGVEAMTAGDALWVGLFQAVAILPGISRSGSTIAGGLWRGLKPKLAADFSFLLSVPAVFGAGLLDLRETFRGGGVGLDVPGALWGTGLSFVFGYLAIRWLIAVVRRGRISVFAYYCWVAGAAVVLWKLLVR
ncbi:MAG TPA: undecaprenyl-diphosphate phosphatase [Bacillota bacterium]